MRLCILDVCLHCQTPQMIFTNNVLITLDNMSHLRRPCRKDYQPDSNLRTKIAGYFKQILPGKKNAKVIKKALPKFMPSWGKVHIAHGGDAIRSASASYNPDKERDMSFVRVIKKDQDLLLSTYF